MARAGPVGCCCPGGVHFCGSLPLGLLCVCRWQGVGVGASPASTFRCIPVNTHVKPGAAVGLFRTHLLAYHVDASGSRSMLLVCMPLCHERQIAQAA